MRLRIGVDLDGVLYRWDDTARHMLRERFGLELSESQAWDYIKDNVPEDAWRWLWTKGVHEGLFRHGSLYKGAADAMRRLCKEHDVVVITKRPRSAVRDTLAWLAYQRWEPREVHIVEGSKTEVRRCDVYVDDSWDNCNELATKFRDSAVLLWNRPWNTKRMYPYRVHTWDEVFAAIEQQTSKAKVLA